MMRAVFVEGTAEQVCSVINEFFRKRVRGGEEWSGGVLNSGLPVERQATADGQLRAAVEFQEHVEAEPALDVKPVEEVKPLSEWQPVELQEDVKRDIILPSAPAPSSSASSYRQHATDGENAMNNAMRNVYSFPSVTSSTPQRKRSYFQVKGKADGQGRRMICSKNTRRCENCGMNTRSFSALESHICLGDTFRCPEIGCTFNSKSLHGLSVHKRRAHPEKIEIKLEDITNHFGMNTSAFSALQSHFCLEGTFRCPEIGCTFNSKSQNGLSVHKGRKHPVKIETQPMDRTYTHSMASFMNGPNYIQSQSMSSTLEWSNTTVPSLPSTPMPVRAELIWPQALLTDEAKPQMTPEQLGGAALPVDEGTPPVEDGFAYYGSGGGGRGEGSSPW